MILAQHIFEQILDEPFAWVSVGAEYPENIIKKIQSLDDSTSSVVLFNGDVWRYGNDQDLLEYLGNDTRKFYIVTLGYKNQKILDNVYELSLPWCFFIRPKNANVKQLENCRYGFSCLNNKSSLHRLVLGLALWKNKLIDDMIFTQNLVDLPRGYHEVLMNEIPGMRDYLSILPISWATEKSKNFPADYQLVEHDAYTNSYCNIVTETEVQDFIFEGPVVDLTIVTEKSYKPFRSRQIPIWLAAPGHCEYLKSLGFEIMEDFLPEGYDDLGLFDKVESIVQTVAKGKEYAKEFYHAHLREIEHNYELVQSNQVDKMIIDNIKNFLASQ